VPLAPATALGLFSRSILPIFPVAAGACAARWGRDFNIA
jgi:hypothetical protein